MKKIKINLFDSLIDHSMDHYGYWTFSPFHVPEKVEWIKPPSMIYDGVTVFTDRHIAHSVVDHVESKYKVAWILECRDIHPWAYNQILMVEHKFDYIFTFDEELLKRGPKYVKSPCAQTTVTNEDAKVYEKTKLLCQIVSEKNYAPGHKIRHIVADRFSERYNIDLFGRAFRPFPEGQKAQYLKDYHFEIVITNGMHRDYFTDGPIDAIRIGTVPIYWGCPNIGEYFNEEGMIFFNSGAELKEILDNLTVDDYYSRIEHIKENFEIAKNWRIRDDLFVDNVRSVISDV